MKELLQIFSKKYFLQLGDSQYSPITKLTAGLSLEYSYLIRENKCKNQPFIFCLPEKKAASLWTSIAILTNTFLEDYVNIEIEGPSVKKGDKVILFNTVAEVERVSMEGNIYLRFKDQGQIPVPKTLKSQVSICKNNRSLNNFSRYNENRKLARLKRNPISKILEPKSEILINQNNLFSKVILIAGRGQVNKFHSLLNDKTIYGEKLSKIYDLDKNLIIRQDLSNYIGLFAENKQEIIDKFFKLLKKALDKNELEIIHPILSELLKTYNNKHSITTEFNHLFTQLIYEYEDIYSELKILKYNYPGITENNNHNIKALIINDINQLAEYSNTINEFLNNKIPVIIFSDRKVITRNDLIKYDQLFTNRPDSFRLNWNKEKIKTLINPEILEQLIKTYSRLPESNNVDEKEEELNTSNPLNNFIDAEVWIQSLRYLKQTIRINTKPKMELDSLIPKVYKHIKLLNEFEVLQKSFYKYFFTALFALKNSKTISLSVINLINKFKLDYSDVKNYIPLEIQNDINETIENALAFEENTKGLEYSENTLSQEITVDSDNPFIIPIGIHPKTQFSKDSQKIIFTGYPYNEYNEKSLINSISKYFIPDIEVVCWPIEGTQTYNYIHRRIYGGYFIDKLPKLININESLLLNSNDDILKEINSYLITNNSNKTDIEDEIDLESIHRLKYKGYQISPKEDSNWIVKCDILNFTDGSFMFLSTGTSILCLTEDFEGKPKVLKKAAEELYSGDIVFRFIKDRKAYVNISKKDNETQKCYKTLDFWKHVLLDLYNRTGKNIYRLEDILNNTKKRLKLIGNPNLQNINRWLYDDELISPDSNHLRIILSTAGIEDIDNHLKKLHEAYKTASAHRISISNRIKKEISKKIKKEEIVKDKFIISIDGENIEVETRKLLFVESNNILVDYHNTRKFLC